MSIEKYKFINNAYRQIVKDNLKNLLIAEVGDVKQPNIFYPQVKISRWGNSEEDNECNLSYRLIHDEKTPTVVEEDGKIKWKGKDIECHFYNLTEGEGGYEFEIILKEKPLTNKVEFTLQDKDVEYFYQPELTQKEKDEGASRPENVVGSYAVYAKTPKTNWTGGKEYKCGKVGHIFRPKIIDSAGTEVWGELHIENGILSVTIPQDFLDKAVYPIRHAAGLTFGYTTLGATDYSGSYNNWFLGGGAISPPDASTITQIGMAAWNNPSSNIKGVMVLHSNLNIISGGVGDSGATPISKPSSDISTWAISNYASPPIISVDTEYVIGVVFNGSGNFAVDSAPTNEGHYDTSNNYTSPSNPTDAGQEKKFYSIYATYTASGGTTPPKRRRML